MEAVVVFLAFPFSLNVHAYLQRPLMYYHSDSPYDTYQVDPITKKKPADQQETFPCQSTYIFYIE